MLSDTPILTLYMKSGCSLCDTMLDELDLMNIKKRFTLHIIDISKNPDLQARFATDIPILFYQKQLLCRYFFDVDVVNRVLLDKH